LHITNFTGVDGLFALPKAYWFCSGEGDLLRKGAFIVMIGLLLMLGRFDYLILEGVLN
jgi:hypothetical protein